MSCPRAVWGPRGVGGCVGAPAVPVQPQPLLPASLADAVHCCSHHRPAGPRPAHSAVLLPTHTVVVNLLVIEWPSSLTETWPSLKVTLGEVALGLQPSVASLSSCSLIKLLSSSPPDLSVL